MRTRARATAPVSCCGKVPCKACAVRPLAVCGILDPEHLPRLAAIAHDRRLAAGSALFREGDPATDVFTLTQGMLKLYKLLPDGRCQITGFLLPGDFLGLAFGQNYVYSAEAVTPARLCRFPRPQFLALLKERPELETALLGRVTTELAAAQEQILLLGRKTATERVASFLLHLADRQEVRTQLDLPMKRADIGDYLGLSLETVSRTLTTFRRAGLIDLADPHRVRIVDRPGIEAATGLWLA